MPDGARAARGPKGPGWFERYLSFRVFLCIGPGILFGRIAPDLSRYLNSLSICPGEAPSSPFPPPSPSSS